MSNNDDFESCTTIERDVTVGDVTRKYLFTELNSGDAEDMFGIINSAAADAKTAANKTLRNRIISRCVTRLDGTGFTEEQAAALRAKLALQFQHIAMEVNGFGGVEKKSKAESESGTSSPSDSDAPSAS